MNGKIVTAALVVPAAIAGIAMYYLQVYACYDDGRLAGQGGDVVIRLTSADGTVADLDVTAFRGIDADSSPIRFRACFDVAPDAASGAMTYAGATPLTGPGWFDCFDAKAIGSALESGAATAYLGEENVVYGVDRVLAIFPDGRGYAWHQINRCGEEVFDGNPPPAGCPPPPEKD